MLRSPMANKVLLKKSAVAGKVPLAGDLSYGEVAINYNDGAMYYKSVDDSIQTLVSPVLTYNKIHSELTTDIITPIDSWDKTKYRTAKYIIQISQGTDYQSSEMLVVHNDTTSVSTEYAVVQTNGSLATLSTDINSGNVRLLITMISDSAATINIKRTLTEV